jgi:hypothetical protein
MKKLLIALLMLPVVKVAAQNNPIFYGGAGDGATMAAKVQTIPNNNAGGFGAGFAHGSLVQVVANANAGGFGDGYSMGKFMQPKLNAYAGGFGDGWGAANYLQTVANAYTGGYGDGWSSDNNTPYLSLIYKGGSGDGWASSYYPLSPLPVDFLGFTATRQKGTALLRWEMGNDENVAYFDVERSAEAVNFTNLGSVKQDAAAGKKYSFVDQTPLKGHNYYRIKLHKKDGSISYTGTRTVIFDGTGAEEYISVFPNPATDRINVKLPEGWKDQPVAINILNISGKLVFHQRLNYNSLITLDISVLLPGTYVIQLANSQHAALAKLTVVK